MALHGPASVLDNRSNNLNSCHIVRDRLTRHRSPAASENRNSLSSIEDDDTELRITQPYRTSFSAVTPVKTRRDRSRSTSPCTSSLKGSSRARSKSPKSRRTNKHVTYDERVLIRDSDTSDSVTNLSDRDLDNTSGHFSLNSSKMSADMSETSQRDYSSELRELSQQIVKEYAHINDKENHSPVLSSHNRNHNHVKTSTPNGTATAEVGYGSRKPKEPLSVQNGSDMRKKIVVQEDYDHDRSVSYRVAIQNNYSEELKQQASEIMKEYASKTDSPRYPDPETPKSEERKNSLPLENDPAIEKSRLSHKKRSISASIGNFFRRLSPHLGRKNKKGNISNASSTSLSPSEDMDGSFRRHASTSSLSRGKLRRSLMKLMGKSKKSPKSADKSESSIEDLNQSHASHESESRKTPKADLYMKSIEQSSKDDKDIYRRFKDKQTPTRSSEGKSGAMKVSPRLTSPDHTDGTTERAQPPDTLDVKMMPKSIKSLQASQISTISADDSVGECSLDPNLTGK